MSADGKFSCSLLKMPDMMFYLGTFTAVPSLLYCVFSVLSILGFFKEWTRVPITVLSLCALPLFTFFCNISMLYFGRMNRKNHKSSYWDWTSLCYSTLIMADIVFIILALMSNGGEKGILVEKHPLIFTAFFVNILIPTVLVPLPSAFECGHYKKYFMCAGMICYLFGIMLAWIMSIIIMAQSGNDSSIAEKLFLTFPFKMFINAKTSHFHATMTAITIVLLIIGYLSHLSIVSNIEGFSFSRAFNKYVIFFVSVPVVVYAASLSYSVVLKNRYSNVKDSLHIPLSVDNLKVLYFNGEQPNDTFWDGFIKDASLLKGTGRKDALAAMTSKIDKFAVIPKCPRDFSKYLQGNSPDLEAIFEYTVFMEESMKDAINKKNAIEAMKIVRRALKIDTLLLGDVYAICSIRHQFICEGILVPFVQSSLATKENKNEIQSTMSVLEKRIDSFYSNVNYWHTLCTRELWSIQTKHDKLTVDTGKEFPIFSYRSLMCIFPQQYCANCLAELNERKIALSGGNSVMDKMRKDAIGACRDLLDNQP